MAVHDRCFGSEATNRGLTSFPMHGRLGAVPKPRKMLGGSLNVVKRKLRFRMLMVPRLGYGRQNSYENVDRFIRLTDGLIGELANRVTQIGCDGGTDRAFLAFDDELSAFLEFRYTHVVI